jgi:hypothetical protein
LVIALAVAADAAIGAGVRWWIRRGGARRQREAWSPMEVASAVFVIGVLTFGALLAMGSSAALTGIVVLPLVSVGLLVVSVGTGAVGRRSRGDRGLER